MRSLFISVLLLLGMLSARAQGFHFTYYEVYKTRTLDTAALWSSARRTDTFERAGTIHVNHRMKNIRVTLKDDVKFEEQAGIQKAKGNHMILSGGWHAYQRPKGDTTGPEVFAIFKNTYWVVYYKKKPDPALASTDFR